MTKKSRSRKSTAYERIDRIVSAMGEGERLTVDKIADMADVSPRTVETYMKGASREGHVDRRCDKTCTITKLGDGPVSMPRPKRTSKPKAPEKPGGKLPSGEKTPKPKRLYRGKHSMLPLRSGKLYGGGKMKAENADKLFSRDDPKLEAYGPFPTFANQYLMFKDEDATPESLASALAIQIAPYAKKKGLSEAEIKEKIKDDIGELIQKGYSADELRAELRTILEKDNFYIPGGGMTDEIAKKAFGTVFSDLFKSISDIMKDSSGESLYNVAIFLSTALGAEADGGFGVDIGDDEFKADIGKVKGYFNQLADPAQVGAATTGVRNDVLDAIGADAMDPDVRAMFESYYGGLMDEKDAVVRYMNRIYAARIAGKGTVINKYAKDVKNKIKTSGNPVEAMNPLYNFYNKYKEAPDLADLVED